MTKEQALKKIVAEISRCPLCKKGGTGKPVPGEGSPDARVMFIGEAPGKEEAKTGRPFVGRSGTFLRRMISEIGLNENEVFITSPCHYLPLRGAPSMEMILHGKEHLFRQIQIIGPDVLVLLGKTACMAVLDEIVEISSRHGTIVKTNDRNCLITFHPAYAMRFPAGKAEFVQDFRKLQRIIRSG